MKADPSGRSRPAHGRRRLHDLVRPPPATLLAPADSGGRPAPAATFGLDVRAAAAVLAAFAALYVLTLAQNHTEAEDSLNYASVIEHGSGGYLFHGNHLLFGPLGWLLHSLLGLLGYAGRATHTLQLMNLAAGIATLAVLARLTGRLRIGRGLSLLTITGTGLSYGFWWYSVEGETYVLPLPFLLLALDRLLASSAAGWRRAELVQAALLSALAVLLHQQHIWLVAAVAATLWLSIPERGIALRSLALYLAPTGVAVAGVYVVVAVAFVHVTSPTEFVEWSRGLARSSQWSGIGLDCVPKALMGIGRAVNGFDFMFGFDSVFELTNRAFPSKLLVEERFLAASLSPAVRWSCLLLAIASAIGFGGYVWPILSRRASAPAAHPERRVLVRTALGMAAGYGVFNLVWEPANLEFWIVLVPVAWLLAAIGLDNRRASAPTLLAGGVLVTTTGLSNLFGSVLPQTSHAADFWHEAESFLLANAKPGDLIVTRSGYISDNYLRFYTGATVVQSADDPEAIRQTIERHRDGRVFVSSWVREPLAELRRTRLVGSTDEAGLQELYDSLGPSLREVARNRFQTVFELMR